jgi:hypothetical protein
MPVQQGAFTTRDASHGAGQRAAAAPAMTAGVSPQGTSSQLAGDMVPLREPSRSRSLVVPMPSHIAARIQSVQIELGGVLLPPDCTQSLTLTYRTHQHALAISEPPNGIPMLAGADLLPSKLLQGDGDEGPGCCLVIRASWPLAPPGEPVGRTLCLSSISGPCLLP